jgi:hypothetical protein
MNNAKFADLLLREVLWSSRKNVYALLLRADIALSEFCVKSAMQLGIEVSVRSSVPSFV